MATNTLIIATVAMYIGVLFMNDEDAKYTLFIFCLHSSSRAPCSAPTQEQGSSRVVQLAPSPSPPPRLAQAAAAARDTYGNERAMCLVLFKTKAFVFDTNANTAPYISKWRQGVHSAARVLSVCDAAGMERRHLSHR